MVEWLNTSFETDALTDSVASEIAETVLLVPAVVNKVVGRYALVVSGSNVAITTPSSHRVSDESLPFLATAFP